jgi:hypothetical protein
MVPISALRDGAALAAPLPIFIGFAEMDAPVTQGILHPFRRRYDLGNWLCGWLILAR